MSIEIKQCQNIDREILIIVLNYLLIIIIKYTTKVYYTKFELLLLNFTEYVDDDDKHIIYC